MANSKYAAFIAAAEEGNMTAAAQKLGTPGMSRAGQPSPVRIFKR